VALLLGRNVYFNLGPVADRRFVQSGYEIVNDTTGYPRGLAVDPAGQIVTITEGKEGDALLVLDSNGKVVTRTLVPAQYARAVAVSTDGAVDHRRLPT